MQPLPRGVTFGDTRWNRWNDRLERIAALPLGELESLADDFRKADERIDQWLKVGRRNPWIREADDPPFSRSSFYLCDSIEELEAELPHFVWAVGVAFHYRDLCLIQQSDGGDEWLTIRYGFPFESITSQGFIDRGEFRALVESLLSATPEQCRSLTYGKQEDGQ